MYQQGAVDTCWPDVAPGLTWKIPAHSFVLGSLRSLHSGCIQGDCVWFSDVFICRALWQLTPLQIPQVISFGVLQLAVSLKQMVLNMAWAYWNLWPAWFLIILSLRELIIIICWLLDNLWLSYVWFTTTLICFCCWCKWLLWHWTWGQPTKCFQVRENWVTLFPLLSLLITSQCVITKPESTGVNKHTSSLSLCIYPPHTGLCRSCCIILLKAAANLANVKSCRLQGVFKNVFVEDFYC